MGRVKSNIQAKESPLKLAETRLAKRSKRPEVEACNDSPHGKLTEEVAELMQNIKQKLESDIKVKSNSLLIDQQKCMSMRRTLPYNIVATRIWDTSSYSSSRNKRPLPCGLACSSEPLNYRRSTHPVDRVINRPKPTVYKVWNK